MPEKTKEKHQEKTTRKNTRKRKRKTRFEGLRTYPRHLSSRPHRGNHSQRTAIVVADLASSGSRHEGARRHMLGRDIGMIKGIQHGP
jgi:hypothetical protein